MKYDQDHITKLEESTDSSNGDIPDRNPSEDSPKTIQSEPPDTIDAIHIETEEMVHVEDLRSLSKDDKANDDCISEIQPITIKPETSPMPFSSATCLAESSSTTSRAHGKCDVFICSECDRSFPSQERINKHAKLHTRVKAYLCPVCQKGFFASHHVRAHVDSVHNKLRPFLCNICQKNFSNKQGLTQHISAVHKILKPFACRFCYKSFAQKNGLKIHVDAVHSDCKINSSNDCHEKLEEGQGTDCVLETETEVMGVLDDPLGLSQEVKVDSVGDSEVITIKPESSSLSFSCATCLAEFSSRIKLKQHVKRMHVKLDVFNCSESECNRSFPSQEQLNKHLRIHKRVKPYLCPHCQKGFFTTSHVSAHVDSVHKKLRPFLCNICQKTFSNKQGLAGHIDAIHKKLKPFCCQFCNKAFAQKNTLEGHIHSVHYGQPRVVLKCQRK